MAVDEFESFLPEFVNIAAIIRYGIKIALHRRSGPVEIGESQLLIDLLKQAQRLRPQLFVTYVDSVSRGNQPDIPVVSCHQLLVEKECSSRDVLFRIGLQRPPWE